MAMNDAGWAPIMSLSAGAGCFREFDQLRRVDFEFLGEFDDAAARNLFLTKGLDGKPHQTDCAAPAQAAP
jgi:hypothetical protein